jgi:hypothetical protein
MRKIQFPWTGLLIGLILSFSLVSCLTGGDSGQETRNPPLIHSEPYTQVGNGFVIRTLFPESATWCDGDQLQTITYERNLYDTLGYVLMADSLFVTTKLSVSELGLLLMDVSHQYIRDGAGQALEGRWKYFGDQYIPANGTPNDEQAALYDSITLVSREAAKRYPRIVEFKSGVYSVFAVSGAADTLMTLWKSNDPFSFMSWFDTSLYAINLNIASPRTVEMSGTKTGSRRVRISALESGDIEFSGNFEQAGKDTIFNNPRKCPNGMIPGFVDDFLTENFRG